MGAAKTERPSAKLMRCGPHGLTLHRPTRPTRGPVIAGSLRAPHNALISRSVQPGLRCKFGHRTGAGWQGGADVIGHARSGGQSTGGLLMAGFVPHIRRRVQGC